MKIKRELKTKDIFTMSKIIKKIGINIEVNTKIQTMIDGKLMETVVPKDSRQIGMEIIADMLGNLSLAEQESNEFFASLCGIKPEEFAEMSITDFVEVIKDFQNIPGIADFFKKAESLTE